MTFYLQIIIIVLMIQRYFEVFWPPPITNLETCLFLLLAQSSVLPSQHLVPRQNPGNKDAEQVLRICVDLDLLPGPAYEGAVDWKDGDCCRRPGVEAQSSRDFLLVPNCSLRGYRWRLLYLCRTLMQEESKEGLLLWKVLYVCPSLPLCLCYCHKLWDPELWPSSQTAQWCERHLFSSNKQGTLWTLCFNTSL